MATSLQINVHSLSSSPRESRQGLERLLFFSPIPSGEFGRRGESWGDLVNGSEMLGGSLGHRGLGECLGKLKRDSGTGGLRGFGECSQDALTSLGRAYELVP